MPRKLPDIPLAVARRFMEDMRVFFAEKNTVKADGIAALQLHALRQYYPGKLRLTDIKKMFLEMKDHARSGARLLANPAKVRPTGRAIR